MSSKFNHPIFFCLEPFRQTLNLILLILLLLLADPPILLLFLAPSFFFFFYFLKSHLRLPGMSHSSTVPSVAAPVILKGRVHLSKQWIKNCPKGGGDRALEGGEKKRQTHGWKGIKRKEKKNTLQVGFSKEPFFKRSQVKYGHHLSQLPLAVLQWTLDLQAAQPADHIASLSDFSMRRKSIYTNSVRI